MSLMDDGIKRVSGALNCELRVLPSHSQGNVIICDLEILPAIDPQELDGSSDSAIRSVLRDRAHKLVDELFDRLDV